MYKNTPFLHLALNIPTEPLKPVEQISLIGIELGDEGGIYPVALTALLHPYIEELRAMQVVIGELKQTVANLVNAQSQQPTTQSVIVLNSVEEVRNLEVGQIGILNNTLYLYDGNTIKKI